MRSLYNWKEPIMGAEQSKDSSLECDPKKQSQNQPSTAIKHSNLSQYSKAPTIILQERTRLR